MGKYYSINSGIKKIIPRINRNDMKQNNTEIRNKVLATNVSNEILDVLAI